MRRALHSCRGALTTDRRQVLQGGREMRCGPRAVIGVPLFNRADLLPEALESLLGQTYGDFALVLVDDCSTDRTAQIAAAYAERDRRITFRRNPRRLGMVGNWRRAFALARELHPEAAYFAWGSDHDVWRPGWLAALVPELERHPEVVLAYPLNRRISETGEILKGPRTFDTVKLVMTRSRFWTTCWRMRAGDQAYGLFRVEALERAGVFRMVLRPDRLLMAELALYGRFKQVPEVLWLRRFGGLFSLDRQRAAFFPDGPPLWSHLPWWLTHAGVLARVLIVEGRGRPAIGRRAGAGYALGYLPVGAALDLRSQWNKNRKKLPRPLRAAIEWSGTGLKGLVQWCG